MNSMSGRTRVLAGITILLLLAWWAYLPGLSGGFLLDDYINIDVLGRSGPRTDGTAFLLYLSSGTADPFGRPLALLSFLIDGSGWPTDPAPFLRTNLLIHLANGVLLFALLRRLCRHLADAPANSDGAALLGAALWLLHPLLVSTTLYAVQREAMLPAGLMLAGLLCYSEGRAQLMAGRPGRGVAWMVAGVCAGTALASLAKANGVLLPLLALVLEKTVFEASDRREGIAAADLRALRRIRTVLLVLPSGLVIAYVGHYLAFLGQDFGRPWTVGAHLLSEPRALMSYLGLLMAPRAVTGGLYNDDFEASSGLLQPWTTLPSALAVLLLLGAGFALRRRSPAWAAAILFFFAGHLLESSAVPLELYFEHRNYLPAMLLFWPAARMLCGWKAPVATRVLVAALIATLFAATTHQRSDLWGHPDRSTALWLARNPESSRAVAATAIALRAQGQPQRAIALLGQAWARAPADVPIAINLAAASCEFRGLRPVDLRLIARTLRIARGGEYVAYRWLDEAVDQVREGRCVGLDYAGVEALLDAVDSNPQFGDANARMQNVESLRGRIALARRQPKKALAHFRSSLAAEIRPEVAASQASMLGAAGYHREAMVYLDSYERIAAQAHRPPPGMPRLHAWLLHRQGYWPGEFAAIRAALRAQAASGVEARPPEETSRRVR